MNPSYVDFLISDIDCVLCFNKHAKGMEKVEIYILKKGQKFELCLEVLCDEGIEQWIAMYDRS